LIEDEKIAKEAKKREQEDKIAAEKKGKKAVIAEEPR
jgi:hypothetical protein